MECDCRALPDSSQGFFPASSTFVITIEFEKSSVLNPFAKRRANDDTQGFD
jgi:hypothetical protein